MANGQPEHLRDALDALLAAGQPSSGARPEITASWRRSIASELRPDSFDVPYEPVARENDRLERAAGPILDRLNHDLAALSMSVLLADKNGHVVERSVGSPPLRHSLDQIMLAPGFRYAEERVGTNAIGTALEQGTPSMVTGGEHFADALTRMACAAAPVTDPITGTVLGVIDLTCSTEDSHPLMAAMAQHAAYEVEQQLVGAHPARDRVLLERFLAARRGARGPLACISDQAMFTNAPAVKLIQDRDRDIVWEHVSAALADQQGNPCELTLHGPGTSVVLCEPILDGAATVGALLRFQSSPPFSPNAGRVAAEGRGRTTLGWESLTATERTIADLVTDGLTNREVAAQVFLSPHTVGYHLRHIYQKLNVASRVELTRWSIERRGQTTR